jgi:N-acetylneuraminic acid mutarotase
VKEKWSTVKDMTEARGEHTATLLADGRVLVAGGEEANGALCRAAVYDPATDTWTSTSNLAAGRFGHTATLLANGRVLITGGKGSSGYLASAELFDPATGAWLPTGSMSTARTGHRAVLLPDGRVLVTGGVGTGGALGSAEVYNPATGAWSSAGSMVTRRFFHSATLLDDGRVLVAGGYDDGFVAGAELYDPETDIWSTTGSLATERSNHSATLLADGRVLVAGGLSANGILASAEVYDLATGNWSPTGNLAAGRIEHGAVRLLDGRVLVAGGDDTNKYLASTEVYNPATKTWSTTMSLAEGRIGHTVTLLAGGRVLVSGGEDGSNFLASAEVYEIGLVITPAWRPSIEAITSPLAIGQELIASGNGWRGYGHTEGSSGGTNNSATNFPLLQLYRLDNAQTLWLPTHAFSETGLTSLPLSDFAPGPALATIYVNGIPSQSQIIQVIALHLNMTTTGTGRGMVTSSAAGIDCGGACSPSFPYNTIVKLTAKQNTGSTFAGWGGACSGLNDCTVTITATQNVTATFTLNTYSITPTSGTHGTITPNTEQTVHYDDTITFTITPDPGYHILDVQVDGISQGATSSYTFSNVKADHNISASFAINTYTITPTSGTGGSITPETAQTVNYGDSISFMITPKSGYQIQEVRVDGASQGTISSYTFNNVNADHAISATFASIKYPIYLPLVQR